MAKNDPEVIFEKPIGMSDTVAPDRIPNDKLNMLLNATCDRSGRISKYPSTYPVLMADALGLSADGVAAKAHGGARARGKDAIERAVLVVGSGMYRSSPSAIAETWLPITWPAGIGQPALDRTPAFVFRNRHCYHQNGYDIPFRVKMWEDDGSTASTDAEPCGLRPPLVCAKWDSGTTVNGTRFFHDSTTEYAITYVYGDRGESGPSPSMYFTCGPTENFDTIGLRWIPIGPAGVTARRIYRTRINTGFAGLLGDSDRKKGYRPLKSEYFFLAEIGNNTSTAYLDSADDSKLDYNRRCPPARPFVPVAKYQVLHQDHFAWSNIKDHPWTLGIHSDLGDTATVTSLTLTISNAGNGTITVTSNLGSVSVADYKTKSLYTILVGLMSSPSYSAANVNGYDTLGSAVARVAPGVDWDRTYRFREVTSQNILGAENVYWMEAIDDSADPVVVDGQQSFPNRTMWSTVLYPEEVNPLNFVDHSRHDNYPVSGLAHNDHTLTVLTEEGIELINGSFFVDPATFRPQFSRSKTQSEHGAFCTRPDAVAVTPAGLLFIARDGLRLFRGQNSAPYGDDIERRLMERILREPRARDNVSLCYHEGKLYIAYPGVEVA